MPAFPAFVSNNPVPDRPSETALIAGVNWLGDSIMCMPAIQTYRQAHPATRLVMLVKPKLASLWSLHRDIDETWTLPAGPAGLARLARRACAHRFRVAFILPHSFRSALVPFLARIPERVGLPGHCRDWLLTRVIHPPITPDRQHQCYEYMALFGVSDHPIAPPRITVPEMLSEAARRRLEPAGAPWVALMPGAVYGPAKRWPAKHFIALGGLLKNALNCGIVLLGSAAERDLCGRVAQGIGSGTVNMAGQTSLPECAAFLSCCALTVANDSGGMHLAAAVGTPVLAIFGITDPRKTGPLGPRAQVLQDSAWRSRDIPRVSEEAATSLRHIYPDQVLEAARRWLV